MAKGEKPRPSFEAYNVLPDLVWLRDLEGTVREVNEAAVQRLGFSRGQVVGKPIFDFYFDVKERPRSLKWSRNVSARGRDFLS